MAAEYITTIRSRKSAETATRLLLLEKKVLPTDAPSVHGMGLHSQHMNGFPEELQLKQLPHGLLTNGMRVNVLATEREMQHHLFRLGLGWGPGFGPTPPKSSRNYVSTFTVYTFVEHVLENNKLIMKKESSERCFSSNSQMKPFRNSL
jgi:hypothetical protein